MSTIKQKIGECPECGDGIKKPLTAGLCSGFHYKVHRQKVCQQRKERRESENPKEEKVRKPINKFSEKRKKETPIYLIKKLQFLSQPENHRCFIEGCNSRADTIEHSAGRLGFYDEWARNNDISLYLDERFWKPCCNYHNLELERNPELSHKYQLSKISGKEKIKK